MTVTVFGLGFVGLTTALGLAHIGHRVYGIESDFVRREILLQGKLPFYEPYMEEELAEQRAKGNISFPAALEQAVSDSEIIFYCVGTPYGKDGAADLTFLFHAIDQTLEAVQDDHFRVLVTKSTIPPSTTARRIAPYVASHKPECARICTANNPEFLREGHCWQDFMEADRVVVGCDDILGQKYLRTLYAPLGAPIYCVSPSTGEFIKYLSNSLLATLISYSNEMAQLGEAIGDVQIADAFHILHMDKRWKTGAMTSYVYPGCGYGGYCLPKDTCALRAQAEQCGAEVPILNAVIETNENRSSAIASWIASGLDKRRTIGIAGLAFKPGSDDVRESPALRVICQLKNLGYQHILAYDPLAMIPFQKANSDLEMTYCESLEELCTKADRIAITTAWPEFSVLSRWNGGLVVDCRYMLGGQNDG